MHVLDIREYTQAEVDAIRSCIDGATGDPDVECPALNEHVSIADPRASRVIPLSAGDVLPDLS